jgi:hypothetical protein
MINSQQLSYVLALPGLSYAGATITKASQLQMNEEAAPA